MVSKLVKHERIDTSVKKLFLLHTVVYLSGYMWWAGRICVSGFLSLNFGVVHFKQWEIWRKASDCIAREGGSN